MSNSCGRDCSRIVATVQNLYARPQALRVVVGIPLRHDDAPVAQQLLHLVEVPAILNEPGGEGVPKIVKVKIGAATAT